MKSLHFKKYNISENIVLSIIELNQFSDIREIIDEKFVVICEGRSGSDLETVKKRVCNLFKTKDKKWIRGDVAEFFVHLYLNILGLKQECLFLNLEENSIKKGFDGFYSDKEKNGWIMESKSGSVSSKSISHTGKVLEAMHDLENKVSGKDQAINPWRNAYSHASHIDVGCAATIRKKLKKLSDDYTNGVYYQIDDFNTVPCGTIYLQGVWCLYPHDEILKNIEINKCKLKGRHIHVICVTNKTSADFVDYISS